MLYSYFLVALGGALGSVFRFGISGFLKPENSWPWPTFVVNILGSVLIGLLVAYLQVSPKSVWRNELLYLGVVGFCGGFTTFSAFSKELFYLLENQSVVLFLLYSIGSLALGVIAFALAYFLVLRLSS
ncbi:MAG TPA: fluoride efflux transporter CrcB [Chitinophagaceae bacterium]|nr:fluoride efflux transporter CrcB [Chitinophagaceae bacterium]